MNEGKKDKKKLPQVNIYLILPILYGEYGAAQLLG